jgi:hypothetical protein
MPLKAKVLSQSWVSDPTAPWGVAWVLWSFSVQESFHNRLQRTRPRVGGQVAGYVGVAGVGGVVGHVVVVPGHEPRARRASGHRVGHLVHHRDPAEVAGREDVLDPLVVAGSVTT